MSMLADKKRRQKWCVNPRGKAWSDDQSKFGQKLLEKMGWSAGQGLGANNQGPTEIVRVRMKDDNKGLGFKENGEEWLKTTSDFNDLLDKLGSGSEEGSKEKVDEPSSLEDRSKKSKARVHYHKFTRGKDLSRYSKKDLASIIGPDAVKCSEDESKDYSSNQINKGSSVDYFNEKIQLGGTLVHQEQDPPVAEAESNMEDEKCIKKAKKSKKKNKEYLVDEQHVVVDDEHSGIILNNKEEQINLDKNNLKEHTTKKTGKGTSKNERAIEKPEESPEDALYTELDKKSSKSKKRKLINLLTEENNCSEISNNSDTINNAVCKKTKKEVITNNSNLEELTTCNLAEETDINTSKNDKKERDKKKKKKEVITNNSSLEELTTCNLAEETDINTSNNDKKERDKKKKKKEVITNNSSIEELTTCNLAEETDINTSNNDKKERDNKKEKYDFITVITNEVEEHLDKTSEMDNIGIEKTSKRRKHKCLDEDSSHIKNETKINDTVENMETNIKKEKKKHSRGKLKIKEGITSEDVQSTGKSDSGDIKKERDMSLLEINAEQVEQYHETADVNPVIVNTSKKRKHKTTDEQCAFQSQNESGNIPETIVITNKKKKKERNNNESDESAKYNVDANEFVDENKTEDSINNNDNVKNKRKKSKKTEGLEVSQNDQVNTDESELPFETHTKQKKKQKKNKL